MKRGTHRGNPRRIVQIRRRIRQLTSLLNTAPMSGNHVYYLKMSGTSSIWYTSVDGIMEPIKTLINYGSTQNFMDSSFVSRNKLTLIPLSKPQTVIAINGKQTSKPVTHKVSLHITVKGKKLHQHFYVMPLGEMEIILGLSW